MDRNVRLVIAYDGTDFHGWQTQPSLRTVQGTVEQAVRRVVRHQVTLIGSGRTDAGVHAAGQVAHFHSTCDIAARNLFRAIGGRLPKDVTLIRVDDVPMTFHATRSTHRKLYRYAVHNATGRPVEHRRQRYTYHFWQPLDLDVMRAAARHLVGTLDFAAMASKGGETETTVRTVRHLGIRRRYEEVHFDVIGEGFLYNQVRNIVGTLLEVGRGHWPPEHVAEILASRARCNAGPTAPARGLCLQWVRYPLAALRRAEAEPDAPAADRREPDADGSHNH